MSKPFAENFDEELDDLRGAGTLPPKSPIDAITRRTNPRTKWVIVGIIAAIGIVSFFRPQQFFYGKMFAPNATPTPTIITASDLSDANRSGASPPPTLSYTTPIPMPTIRPETPGQQGNGYGAAGAGGGASMTLSDEQDLGNKIHRDANTVAGMHVVQPIQQPVTQPVTPSYPVYTAPPTPTPIPMPPAPAEGQAHAPSLQSPDQNIYVVQGNPPTMQIGSPALPVGSEGLPVGASPNTSGAGVPATYSQTLTNNRLRFLAESGGAEYLNSDEAPPLAKYEVLAGTRFYLRLKDTINTNMPGYAWAEFERPVQLSFPPYKIVIPQYSRLRGEYNANTEAGDGKVQIKWDLIILPNGYTFSLLGMQGADPDGSNGLSGDVNDHKGRLITSVLIGAVLDAGAAAVQPASVLTNPRFGQEVAGSLAANATNTASQVVQKQLSAPPTITVPAGREFVIVLPSTLTTLVPYDTLPQPQP